MSKDSIPYCCTYMYMYKLHWERSLILQNVMARIMKYMWNRFTLRVQKIRGLLYFMVGETKDIFLANFPQLPDIRSGDIWSALYFVKDVYAFLKVITKYVELNLGSYTCTVH